MGLDMEGRFAPHFPGSEQHQHGTARGCRCDCLQSPMRPSPFISIFHNSQLTPYHDGGNRFPPLTPETVQPCEVAHLDDWEDDNEEFAVSEVKAARKDPRSSRMKWLVGFRGYAADSDLWIEDSQMNDLLRAEARTRNAELLAEGQRITLLEAAAATNRAQPRGRQRAAAASVTTAAGAAPPLRRPHGRPRKVPPAPAAAAPPEAAEDTAVPDAAPATAAPPKRPRGRPRKAPPAVALSLEGEGAGSASR